MTTNRKLKAILDSSYQDNTTAAKTLARKGYTLDKNMSGEREKVFTNRKGKVGMVVRGSVTAQDWLISDPKIARATLQYGERVRHTNQKLTQIRKRYGGQDAALYGHSLGGSTAMSSNGIGRIIAYNPGISIPFLQPKQGKNVSIVRTKGDIVSMFAPKNKRNTIIDDGGANFISAHGTSHLKKK